MSIEEKLQQDLEDALFYYPTYVHPIVTADDYDPRWWEGLDL